MKVFGVLLLTLCTTSLVFGYSSHRSSNTNSNDFEWDFDQQWQGQQENLQEQQTNQDSSSSLTNSDDSLASEFINLLPYRSKITQRLENSEALRNQPETKEKLMKFWEDKLHLCSNSNTGKNMVNRQCIGRLTGQMMQMIAIFEKGTQLNMPLFNNWWE